jgi:parvulin-like peptidyl-prolyl isomerase
MPLKGIQITNTRLPAILAAALFLAFHSLPTLVNAQQGNRSQRIAELEKRLGAKITKEDIEALLKDANPMLVRRLAENPDLKKVQLENLRQLVAMTLQALKEKDFVDDGIIAELDDIQVETIARVYDARINKGKKPFSAVGQDRIDAFYADPANQTRFSRYIKSKTDQAKKDGRLPADQPISEKLIQEAKDIFARVSIYEKEAAEKAADLGADYQRKADFTVRLQQSQYLSGIYSKAVVVEKLKVTDADIDAYLNEHPDLVAAKKARANEILLMARSGKDFAALANEFTEDPGNKDAEGRPQGGIYKDVTKGKMVAQFEQAALALEPGQISGLVETDYGYHILKLEKKGMGKDFGGKLVETYDVRHILIATTTPNTDNPRGRPVAVKEMVRSKLETERENRVMGELVGNNPVDLVEDFEVPVITDEQIQEALKNQTNAPAVASTPAAAIPALPAKLKKYLNMHYRGWKLPSADEGCAGETNAFVRGDFDGDGKRDYAVKFIKGKKGYMLSFLRRGNNYKAFVLHNTGSNEMIYSSLTVWKKGEIFEKDAVRFRLRRDAPADYHCESDVGGIHYYRNGKFVDY